MDTVRLDGSVKTFRPTVKVRPAAITFPYQVRRGNLVVAGFANWGEAQAFARLKNKRTFPWRRVVFGGYHACGAGEV